MGRDYSYLSSVQDGDTQTAVEISLRGFTPSAGGSGHAQPGNYRMEIGKAAWVAKKEGKVGRNLRIEMRTAEPEAYKGVPVVMWIPQPTDQGEKDFGYRQLQSLAWSAASAQGSLEAARSAESLKITPAHLVGKSIFAELGDGEGQYANRSQVERFLTKEEFSASPGPHTTFANTGAPQTSTPEVLGANGSKGPAQSKALDNVLFG